MTRPKIGLDAGHSADSKGTYSIDTVIDGLYEKDYTLELVEMIDEYLKINDFETYLTRKSDKNPGNVSERAKKCAEAGCTFALSVHFNGFDDETANGTECYVPYEEKAANIEVGFREVLTKYFKERKPFARACGPHSKNEILDKKMNSATNKFEATSTKADYFGFIRTAWGLGLSADLIEICFLTNRKDFTLYKGNKREIAKGLAKAIVEGYGRTFKEEKKEPVVVLPPVPEKPKEPEKPEEPPKPVKKPGLGRLNKKKIDLKL